MNDRDLAWVELDLVRRDWRRLLPFWHFKNRETGAIQTFRPPSDVPCPSARAGCRCVGAGLWPGQARLADAISEHPWLFALKAGKLGFTELECAWDGWVALCGQENSRVHLFSKDDRASKALLGYVRFGLASLPARWGVQFLKRTAGGSTQKSLIFRTHFMRVDDERTIVSYPATSQVAIDQSCQHSHVDELSHMANGEELWNSVITTIPEGGTIHIVTRGAGDSVYSAELWEAAEAGTSPLHAFFARYDERPDRDDSTRERLRDSMSPLGLSYFLPESAADALSGDEDSPYIPIDRWDALFDKDLPLLLPGSREALVLGVDAAVTQDCFAIVGVTRHPERHDDVAIRVAKVWKPDQFKDGRIDFVEPEQFIRHVMLGGCRAGHSRPILQEQLTEKEPGPRLGCEYCEAGQWDVPKYNVVQVTYDPHQLEDMMQRLRRLGVGWFDAFDQGSDRLKADGQLFHVALAGKLTHNGHPDLREHIGNAKAKVSADEDSKMRIIKKSPARKIDLAVAASMAQYRCKYLLL